MNVKLQAPDNELFLKFHSLRSFQDVATLLEVTPGLLRGILYEHVSYKEFEIIKKNGKVRKISAPEKNLKILQKKLKYILEKAYYPRECVHGYVDSKGIRTNASKHLRSRVILNIDLQDFFPTITWRRVYGMFRAKPFSFNPKVSATLANICCYKESLPQGAPTSPIVSNIICSRLDSHLTKIAGNYKCYYTRYADDLTFSTKLRKLPAAFETDMLSDKPSEGTVSKIIADNGFLINPTKVKSATRSNRQQVTGVIINQKLNVRREYYRRIRAALHDWETNGYEVAKKNYLDNFYNKLSRNISPSKELGFVLKGQIDHIGFIKGTSDPCYIKLLTKMYSLVPKFVSHGEFETKIQPALDFEKRIRRSLWVIESESGNLIEQGSAFPLLFEQSNYLVTADHCLVGDEFEIRKPMHGKLSFKGKVLIRFPKLDIALIRIEENGVKLDSLEPGNSRSLKSSDNLLICGFPNHNGTDQAHIIRSNLATKSFIYGYEHLCLSHGIISGNSGGPIINQLGQVVGVAVRGSESFTENRNKNLAVPIEELLQAIRTFSGN